MEPNGVIEGYNISYREIEGNTSEDFQVGPDYLHKAIISLSEFLVCSCILNVSCNCHACTVNWF